jgi:hypothetical protein
MREYAEKNEVVGCGFHRARACSKTRIRLDESDLSGHPFPRQRPCTLEQLSHCVTRKMKINRPADGRCEVKVLMLDLQPWWKTGTVRRARRPSREKENLVCQRTITLKDALCGHLLSVRGPTERRSGSSSTR